MEKIINDERLAIKICDLYYNQNLTHLQISEKLNISRPTVSKVLSSAREKQIVEITINRLDTVKYWEIEQRLKKQYQLRNVIVVDSGNNDSELLDSLGKAAQEWLSFYVKDGDTVGVSMGLSLYHTVYSELQKNNELAKDVLFVPLIGGMGKLRTELHSNYLAEILARKYRGKSVALYAPARIANPSICSLLKKESSIASVLQFYKQLDVAIVGIGYPNEKSSIKATGYYKRDEIQSLIERDVAGEICMQFYNAQGNATPYKRDNNVIGMELNKLKKVPCSIGVAGGEDKALAIKGAVCGGYINVLIMDNKCAEKLLELG